MKKFYVLIVVIICSAAQSFSQTYTWVGASGGNWTTSANWSGGAGYPNSDAADVLFNTNVTVNLDASVDIKSLTVSGTNRVVEIDGLNNINVASGNPTAPTFTVDATNTLRLSQVYVSLADNIVGTINGTLVLEGTDITNTAILALPNMYNKPAAFTINGTLTDEYGNGIVAAIDDYLRFSAGSKFQISGIAPVIPFATYHAASEIIITGATVNPISFREKGSIGSLTYNCPLQANEITLNVPTELIIEGSLNIQGTNGNTLVLISNDQTKFPTQTSYEFTVNGNLNITNNSVVALSDADDASNYRATINGNLVVNGSSSSFSIQNSNITGLLPTTLYVKGNINHAAGTITAVSTKTATSESLFNIEMNGTTAQTITSTPQLFDNAGHQVALRISNSTNGVTLLTPLNVGMLGFSSNGKLITTQTNFVKIMNPATASYVVSGSGFVDGFVRRATNQATEYIFPTGAGTTAQYVSVFPETADESTYEASFTNAAPANTTVTSPLINIANYYWQVDRISTGANAYVELSLPGAVSGANSSHALVVSKSSGGANWVSSRNLSVNTFLSGDATSGKVRSELQTSFSSFTIGWGPMDAVLPINLLSFTVNKSGSKANLNWKITGNSTPQSFDVMKSTDGVNFNKIGTVSGLTAKLSYDFTDNNLVSGNNYYRLKMFDIDGTVSYSNIIVAMNGTSGTLITSMMPTMVIDRARLNISSASKGNMQLVITDINGRIIQTQNASINAGNQEIWINATRLATGYFQITGYINGEKTATIRFFKR